MDLPAGYRRRFVSSAKYLSDISVIEKEELEVEAIYGPKGIVLTREMLSYIVGGLGSGGEPLKAPSATRLAGSQVTEASAVDILLALFGLEGFFGDMGADKEPGPIVGYSKRNAADGAGVLAVTDLVAAPAAGHCYRVTQVKIKTTITFANSNVIVKIGGTTVMDGDFGSVNEFSLMNVNVKGPAASAITVEGANMGNGTYATVMLGYRDELE